LIRPQARRLRLIWWACLALALLPLVRLESLLSGGEPLLELSMPVFITGLLSLFASLPLFNRYKKALMALARADSRKSQADAWVELVRRQRRGLIGAALPAWIAALGVPLDLEPVGMVLLALASLGVLVFYRLPRQLAQASGLP